MSVSLDIRKPYYGVDRRNMFMNPRFQTAQLFPDEGGPLFINHSQARRIDICPSRDLAVLTLAT